MMTFFAALSLNVIWTVLSAAIVILEEPPAFIAHAFGIVTGVGWMLLVLLRWIRQDAEGNERGD